MDIRLSQRFMHIASISRYYLLVVGFVLFSVILMSIARAFQTDEYRSPQILSLVLDSYKKISEQQTSKQNPLLFGAAIDLLQQNRSPYGKAPTFSPSLTGKASAKGLIGISPELEQIINGNSVAASTESLHSEISAQIDQYEADRANSSLVPQDNAASNYLLLTLFPHRKSAIIEEPIVNPYRDNLHQDDISMLRIADKIDHSLSFSDNDFYDLEPGSEADFDEYYEYETAEPIEPIAHVYPYLPDPLEILEVESALSDFKNLPNEEQIDQLLTTGDYFLLANNPIKARQYYVQAVKKGAEDKNSPYYAKALVKLADLEENPYLARFQYTNALDIYEALVGFDLEVADILVKLVWTLDMSSERIVIYELLSKAKQIHEKHPYSPQYTEVLRNLAIYYETVNDFEKADANYKAALALDLQHLTTNDIRTVLALENYAGFYLKFHEYDKAEEILLFKLAAHEEVSPPDYYNLGRTQSMLGWTNLQQNDFEESLHYYNSALGNINYSITKNKFMPHYYSLPAIFDLIYFFVKTDEPDRAEPYLAVATTLLENENEGFILNYLKEADRDAISSEDIVNYPWAFEAEVDGLIAILNYLDQQSIDD